MKALFLGTSVLVLSQFAQAAPIVNMNSAVQAALRANAEAKDLEAWHASSDHPHELFAKALSSIEGKEALCSALEKLGAEDLGLFDEEMAEHPGALPCEDALKDKMAAYWSYSRQELLRESLDRSAPDQLADAGRKTCDTLPSLEVNVFAAQGGTYNDAGLPKGHIAITLDDGPHPSRTGAILDILKRENVRVTFFSMGKNAREYPNASRRSADEGHMVGSHTWSHQNLPPLSRRSMSAAEEEITRGREAVAQASGTEIPFFRFPYGARNSALTQFVAGQGMASFLWNMDSLDWKLRNPAVLWRNVIRELDREQRGIILFHDIHEQTVITLPRLLDELKARCYSTVVFVPR